METLSVAVVGVLGHNRRPPGGILSRIPSNSRMLKWIRKMSRGEIVNA